MVYRTDRWSTRYPACTECGQTKRAHAGGGLCVLCYSRKRTLALPQKTVDGWCRKHPEGCRGCGTKVRKHCRFGLCSRCNCRQLANKPYVMIGDPEYKGAPTVTKEEPKIEPLISGIREGDMYHCANPTCPDRKALYPPNHMCDYKGKHFCSLLCVNEYARLIGVKVMPVGEFSSKHVDREFNTWDYTNDYLKGS